MRGRAGPHLLATILEAKFGQHLPLNRLSETFARECIYLCTSTIGDWVGASTATITPLMILIDAHALAAERLHGDDTTVPVLAAVRTDVGRFWTYVRDDAPFCGTDPPAAIFHYSRDRKAIRPERHLANYIGILEADAYAGFNVLYAPGRQPGPILDAACWAHGAFSSQVESLGDSENATKRFLWHAQIVQAGRRASHATGRRGRAPD
jgi:hypothetical protein